MKYFMLRCTTDVGPGYFPIKQLDGQTLADVVKREAKVRAIEIYDGWTTESLDEEDYLSLTGGPLYESDGYDDDDLMPVGGYDYEEDDEYFLTLEDDSSWDEND